VIREMLTWMVRVGIFDPHKTKYVSAEDCMRDPRCATMTVVTWQPVYTQPPMLLA